MYSLQVLVQTNQMLADSCHDVQLSSCYQIGSLVASRQWTQHTTTYLTSHNTHYLPAAPHLGLACSATTVTHHQYPAVAMHSGTLCLAPGSRQREQASIRLTSLNSVPSSAAKVHQSAGLSRSLGSVSPLCGADVLCLPARCLQTVCCRAAEHRTLGQCMHPAVAGNPPAKGR